MYREPTYPVLGIQLVLGSSEVYVESMDDLWTVLQMWVGVRKAGEGSHRALHTYGIFTSRWTMMSCHGRTTQQRPEPWPEQALCRCLELSIKSGMLLCAQRQSQAILGCP